MIKDAGSKFDDYSISHKIRQILLHWSYELTEKEFFNNLKNWRIKMSIASLTDKTSCKKQKKDILKKKLLSIVHETKKQ